MNRNLSLSITLAVAMGLWGTSAVVANKLSGKEKFLSSEEKSRHTHPVTPQNSALLELGAAVEKSAGNSAENVRARVRYADALARTGLETRDMPLLGKSLEQYSAALQLDPNSKEAVLGIASLSFEAGVLDKAESYYRRYLELDPANTRAQNDYALVLVQQGRAEEAVPILEKIVEQNADFFPPRLSLALAYRVAGNESKAKEQALAAQDLAPDETAKQIVLRFLSEKPKAAETNNPAVQAKNNEMGSSRGNTNVSPASAVNTFFRNHPVIGPKIESIAWDGPRKVNIRLKDFPVEKMPPFARTKLESNVRGLQQEFGEPISIVFLDATDSRELLSFPGVPVPSN